jgi:hypothetical protein
MGYMMGRLEVSKSSIASRSTFAVMLVAVALLAASCTSSEPVETTTTAQVVTTTTTPPPTTTSTTVAPTTTSTLPNADDPDALLSAVNEVMAAQPSFLVAGEVGLFENFGDSEETFGLTFFRGGQDAERNHWIDAEISFGAALFEGTFEAESRDVNGVEFEQDLQSGDWEIEEPDGEFGLLDTVFAGELVMADITAFEVDGSYELRGTVPADPTVETVVMQVRTSDLALESVRIRTLESRDDFVALIGEGDTPVYTNERWTLSDYGIDVALVQAPTAGLSTSRASDGLFSLQVPNHWTSLTVQEIEDAELVANDAWVTDEGLLMMVLVEDLIEAGFGETTLENYVNFIVANALPAETAIDEILEVATIQGLPSVIITGATDETGLLPFVRLFYLHDGTIGFNLTIVGPALAFENDLELIVFVMNTFILELPPLNPFEQPDA